MGMSLGEEAQLLVHESHGYGNVGAPGPVPIPAGSSLVFNVKLMEIDGPRANEHSYQTDESQAPANKLMELRSRVENLSIPAWLREVDKSGSLAQYATYIQRI